MNRRSKFVFLIAASILASAAWTAVNLQSGSSTPPFVKTTGKNHSQNGSPIPLIVIKPGESESDIKSRNPKLSQAQAQNLKQLSAVLVPQVSKPPGAQPTAAEKIEPAAVSNPPAGPIRDIPAANTWARDKNGQLLPDDPYQAAAAQAAAHGEEQQIDSSPYFSQTGQAASK